MSCISSLTTTHIQLSTSAWIAKIDAEGNPRLLSPLMLAVAFSCGKLEQPDAERFDFASTAAPGGADRDRTDDPLLAKQVLSQLSYSPGPKVRGQKAEGRSQTGCSAFCPRTSDVMWWA